MLSFIDNIGSPVEASMVTSSTSKSVRAARTITIALLVLSIGFTALVLVSVVTGLFRHGDSLLYGDSITVPMQVSGSDLGQLPDGISAGNWLDVYVTIQDPTTSQMLLRSVQDLGPAVVIVWALWLLTAVLNAAAHGDPFGRDNARRFRSLALVLIAGGFALTMMNYAVLNAFLGQVPAYPSIDLAAGPFSPLPAGMLMGGLVAFALAAIFADGARLREDVEGMV
ncbi:DUF2975 domain-containing protein [Nocardioides coralli]|uniref:DUF2975 domain-containing protein n=1 Tax=Nocardioides coralli TaxID=2872154 RepID=UPI001CA45851|nr:DUF2975 domain-containing protein [Nocardioides coralli]QZY29459.1 DUF2975 domain-containing protein [Nocardioides coralli]